MSAPGFPQEMRKLIDDQHALILHLWALGDLCPTNDVKAEDLIVRHHELVGR